MFQDALGQQSGCVGAIGVALQWGEAESGGKWRRRRRMPAAAEAMLVSAEGGGGGGELHCDKLIVGVKDCGREKRS